MNTVLYRITITSRFYVVYGIILVILFLYYMEQSKNNVALVAGGAGFIGSHLCERLLDDGYEVICLDNLYTGSIRNINHLLSESKFTFVNHDVTVPYDVEGLSVIFNLAFTASPVHYQQDAVSYFRHQQVRFMVIHSCIHSQKHTGVMSTQ